MYEGPDAATLLDGLARFLAHDLRGAVPDPGVSFRTLIAARLATMVAAELRNEDEHDAAELTRLRVLVPDVRAPMAVPHSRVERREAIAKLSRALAERIRSGDLTDEERDRAQDRIKRTLVEKLSVINPRFDTSQTIE